MSDEPEYRITIVRKSADGGSGTIEHDGYALLHEAVADILHTAAQAGWLADWPELPRPDPLTPE
ncbi:MAG TPA: hypothetical protein VGH84_11955 [Steroidobacteraceae bacterium]|jgi:hypothetical protein